VVAPEVEPEAPATVGEEPVVEEEAAPVEGKYPTHYKCVLLQFPPGPHRVHRWAHTRTPYRLHLTHLRPQSLQLRASHKLCPPMQQLPLPWIWAPQPPLSPKPPASPPNPKPQASKGKLGNWLQNLGTLAPKPPLPPKHCKACFENP
jgi:hypothetical protein